MPVVSQYRSVLHYEDKESLVKALEGLNVSQDQASSSDWQLSLYNRETTKPPSAEDEASRLMNLREYDVLETDADPVLDKLTSRTREEYDVPWVCLSMVDMGRQWFKSVSEEPGREINKIETSRKHAFCAHTILLCDGVDPVLEVRDTHSDERFRENPLVTDGPKLRYYAGAPLVTPEGHRLGALCILDYKPHPQGLSEEEHDHLMKLAEETVQQLVQRKQRRKQQQQLDLKPEESADNVSVSKKRSAEQVRVEKKGATPRRSGSISSVEDEAAPKKRSRSPTPMIAKPNVPLPDPKAPMHPDKFLVELVEAMHGVKLKITPALELEDYFLKIQEAQMAAYSMEVVSAARENNVDKIKSIYEERGREALDCYNRFGEGMLNLACRRGFTDMVQFLLHDVNLNVRVSDDYGRTPLHDACWNPEPQLEICTWLTQRDPSLFLIADKRGYTPFQYARASDWQSWRDFLFENRQYLEALVRPEILSQFSSL